MALADLTKKIKASFGNIAKQGKTPPLTQPQKDFLKQTTDLVKDLDALEKTRGAIKDKIAAMKTLQADSTKANQASAKAAQEALRLSKQLKTLMPDTKGRDYMWSCLSPEQVTNQIPPLSTP